MRHLDPTQLQRLVDGELGQRRARKLSSHLESCSECAAAAERIRATGDLLRLAFDEALDEAPLEGFADAVMEKLAAEPKPLPFTERARAWLGEFFRYRRKLWAPPLALSGAAAVALLVVLVIGQSPPSRELPPGSSVISVSFGSSVEGAVFEVEDKDGSTTAVIWLDESKSTGNDTEASYYRGRGVAANKGLALGATATTADKGKDISDTAVAAQSLYWFATAGAKTA